MDGGCNSGGGGGGGGFSSGGGDFGGGGGGFSSGGGNCGGGFSSGGGDFGGGGGFSSGGGTDFGGGGFSSGGGVTDFGGGGFSYANETNVGHMTSGVGYVPGPRGGHIYDPYSGGARHGYPATTTSTRTFGQSNRVGHVTNVGGAPTTVYQPARRYITVTRAKPVIIFFIIFCVVFVILAIIIPVIVVSTAASNFGD